MSSPSWLQNIRGVLLDVDGVLYRGNEILPGAREFLAFLVAKQIPYLYVTNNSTLSPQGYAAKLHARGFPARPEQVVGSAEATAHLLRQRFNPLPRVLLVGEEGLATTLQEQGIPLVTEAEEADVVVAGLDRQITYARLAEATFALHRGVPFFGTNPDRTLPTERGLAPGAGAILAALTAATDRDPIIVGKPERPIFELALARLGLAPEQVLMIGDRLETDILGAKRVGCWAALVLTGVTSAPPPPGPHAPDLVVRDLVELRELWG